MKFLKGIGKKVSMLAVVALVAAVSAVGSAFASPPSDAIDFTGMSGLSVDPLDVISTGFSFMNMFGKYTTLVLGVIFAPVAIGFVLWIWGKLPRLGKR